MPPGESTFRRRAYKTRRGSGGHALGGVPGSSALLRTGLEGLQTPTNCIRWIGKLGAWWLQASEGPSEQASGSAEPPPVELARDPCREEVGRLAFPSLSQGEWVSMGVHLGILNSWIYVVCVIDIYGFSWI